MSKPRSLLDVLAALGTGASLLAVGCSNPPPPVPPVGGQEVPAAVPSAVPSGPLPAVVPAPPLPGPTAAPVATPVVPAVPAKPKAMPAKIPNSKRVADKSATGCCGAGTCAPC